MLHLYLLVALLIECIQCEDRNTYSVYKKLREDLFKDYDRNARPVIYNSNVTMVSVELTFVTEFEINEQAQTIDIDSYMELTWFDHHLAWDCKGYQGIEYFEVSANDVWVPNIHESQRSVRTSNIQQSDYSLVLLDCRGLVHWLHATVLPGTCTFDYNNYPTDVAICKTILQAWNYKRNVVDVKPVAFYYREEQTSPKRINSLWEIADIVTKKIIWGNYSAVQVTFTLQRKAPIFQQQLLWIASVIIILLTLGMFWIPANIEQKITVGCVMMTIMTAVLLTVAYSVNARQPMILIAGTIHNLMFASTAAILLEIIAINLQHIQEWKPPEFLLNIFSGPVGRILLISSTQNKMISVDKVKLSEDENEDAMMEKLVRTGNWKTISQAFDRVAFLVYIIVLSAIPKTP